MQCFSLAEFAIRQYLAQMRHAGQLLHAPQLPESI
jgi:hypothetical protein